jgi:phosphoribosylformylglycinamidine synthase I
MPRALIITAPGINCDLELGRAFELAGAHPESMLLNQLMRQPELIDRYDLIGIPGGFSYGDAIAAGRIAAQLMRRSIYPALVHAIQRGTPIICPCNGFQIAVQIGLLPGPLADGASLDWPAAPPRPTVALAQNAGGQFIDRWCAIEIPDNTRCIWTQSLDAPSQTALLPIAHGEGRFVTESDDLLQRLDDAGQIALRYAPGDNPNGSSGNVAGICDATGLVFGLMPHPERYTQWTHHPSWTRLPESATHGETPGLQMFRNAVNHVLQNQQTTPEAAMSRSR